MSIRKTCKSKGCRHGDSRCLHTWESRLTVKGTRCSVSIDDYVAARGGRAHVHDKRDAEKVEREEVEPEWRAGGDPRKPPKAAAPDAHSLLICMQDYRAWELKQLAEAGHAPAMSEMRHIVLYFGGARPVVELERVALVQQFKDDLYDGWRPKHRRLKVEPDDNELGEGHGREQPWLPDGRDAVAVNRILQRQRHFMRWCLHQSPPLVTRHPFHQFGVTIDISDEEPRGRRLHDGEEAALLKAAREHHDAHHQFAGAAIERRIRGALGLAARGSELDRVQVKHVDYKAWIVTLTKGKSRQPRPIWVPDGELRDVLTKRRFLGPEGYIFGDDDGAQYEDRTAWEAVVLRAYHLRTTEQVTTVMETGLQFRDLRRECASRWWEAMNPKDLHKLSLWLGHSSTKVTQRYLGLSDAELGDNGMQRTLEAKR